VDVSVREPFVYAAIGRWLEAVLHPPTVWGPGSWGAFTPEDPTDGCDHFNDPDRNGYPEWTRRCDSVRKIGRIEFYRTKPEFR
jgi:hypothetical protein